jgi:2-keto-4-pentenoate hydratase/2-oxohepta-3-ene-1,7-dioic acid hydratase in catechol pathway
MTELFTLARLGAPGREIPVVRSCGRLLDASSVAADYDAAFFGGGGIDRIRDALGRLPEFDGVGQRIGAPIARPGKIVCIGLNYRDHAEETGAALPAEPVIFMKDPSTIVGPFDDVLIPRGSTKTDWEVELGVVIGTTARYLASPDEALSHVAGYAVSHDVSEREFQLERGGQWDKGKSCETFNPFGPDLVPAEYVDDPQQLGLRLWVNGEARQDGSTRNMLFSVAHVIWYLSQFMVLHPGDVINTGTPAGVALGLPGTPYLREGDRVEIEIDGLGRASQRMVQA